MAINKDIKISDTNKTLNDIVTDLSGIKTSMSGANLSLVTYNWDGNDNTLKNLFASLAPYQLNIGAFYRAGSGSGFFIGSNEANYGSACYLVGIANSLRIFQMSGGNWNIITVK